MWKNIKLLIFNTLHVNYLCIHRYLFQLYTQLIFPNLFFNSYPLIHSINNE
jgi:hypothetical protein